MTGLLTPTSPCATLQSVTTYQLKTAVAPIIAGNTKTNANILFDEGAQRSFISIENWAYNQLPQQTFPWQFVQRLGIATVEIETLTGELIPVSVLSMPHLQGGSSSYIQQELHYFVFNWH